MCIMVPCQFGIQKYSSTETTVNNIDGQIITAEWKISNLNQGHVSVYPNNNVRSSNVHIGAHLQYKTIHAMYV